MTYFAVFILLNAGYFTFFILILLVIVWAFKVYDRDFLLNKIEIAYVVMAAAFTIFLVIFHHSIYDILRFATLLGCPAICLILFKKTSISRLSLNRIFYLYIVTIIANLIFSIIFASGQRNSIFMGSENIGLIILSMFYVLVVSWPFSSNRKLLATLLFLVTLASMGARTVLVIVAVLLVRYLWTRKWTFKSLSRTVAGLTPILIISSMFVQSWMELPRIQRMLSITEVITDLNYSELQVLQSQENVPLRIRLALEARDLIVEKPWLGHGVKTPKTLEKVFGQGQSSFHNSVSDILVAHGIIGAIFIGIFFWQLYKIPKLTGGNPSAAFGTIFIIFLISSLIQPIFFSVQVCTLFYFFIALSNLKKEHNNQTISML